MSDKKTLSKAEIFNSARRKPEPVDVPEWGGVVHVRPLTAGERDQFESSNVRVGPDGKPSVDMTNYRARLVCLAACDEKGKRLFVDYDANEIGRQDAAAVDRVFEAAQRLNGMGAKASEEIRKN